MVEEPLGICGAGPSFGMELDGEKRQGFMDYSFVGIIVGVIKPSFKARRQFFFVDGEAVILGGDVAAF